jgi:outer membrane protein OmpA-like peptidoglycan-associated protein
LSKQALRVAMSAARLTIIVVALAISACAYNKGTVVLLPEKDGRDTAVTIMTGDKKVVLDKPYAAAEQTAFGPSAYQSNAQDVNAKFGPALAAQPARPQSFTLYFVEGKDEFTDDSKRIIDGVFTEIAAHPVPDVVVVGHTDRVGSDPSNDALARQRADTVRAELIRRGVAPENIVAVGRGSREPLIPTAAGVAEPRNRRVEIIVR